MTLSSQPESQLPPNVGASNASADPNAIETALQRHDLAALFIQHLGWEPLSDDNIERSPLLNAQVKCTPIARQQDTVVWKIQIVAKTALTSSLREQIYGEIVRFSQVEDSVLADAKRETTLFPIVIFVAAEGSRSLWCQQAGRQDELSKRAIESALYISGQPAALWNFRLNRLKRKEQSLFPSFCSQAYLSFQLLLDRLCEGITEVGNITDRQNYAALTLQRLILLQAIQQKGWMHRDRWYLQTRFGEALQMQKSFFKDYLQPLYQCLALPKVERPTAANEQIGKVPFLGHLFHTHRLEQKYPTISIENQPFEQILGWLSEQTSTDSFNPWMSKDLSYCLEQYLANQSSAEQTTHTDEQGSVAISAIEPCLAEVSSVEVAKAMSDRTLNQLVLNRAQSVRQTNSTDINDLLFNADTKTCRYLTEDLLPNLRILDPACGSGSSIVETYQRLTEIFSNLIGYSQQNQAVQLNLQAAQRLILKNILHGVDISMQAVEATMFQLLLHTVSTAQRQQDIEPLVDLSFNILVGNSLIGLIDVDTERFETVQRTSDREIVQGSLLQPLVADSYQTILAEKNLAVEHYKHRNQMLADARNIPDYARAALLKEDILRLDINAQQKLDKLLLNQMSQQLGIQYKAAQLDQKPQRRALTLEDIDILQPFHWGYHFNKILDRGGFDIVVCQPPAGAFKPTATEFFQKFRDLAEVKGMNVRSLKTSKQALAKGDPEIAQAWLFYQDQYAYVADYFYRSEQYAHQNPTVEGKTVRNQLRRERLFAEQCFNLISDRGIYAVVLSEKLSEQPKAQTIQRFLQARTKLTEIDIEGPSDGATVVICEKMPEAPSKLEN